MSINQIFSLPDDFTDDPTRTALPRQLIIYEEVFNTWSPCTDEDTIADTEYLAVSYRQSDFPDKEQFERTIHDVCHFCQLRAYWLDYACIGQAQEEKNRDLYRIADVFRGASKTLIMIKGDNDKRHSPGWISWGDRIWTLPEALLSAILIYKAGTRPIKSISLRRMANLAYQSQQDEMILVDGYSGREPLSLPDRVELLRKAIWKRHSGAAPDHGSNGHGVFAAYTAEKVYALMGLMPYRIVPDPNETEEQAFQRLITANKLGEHTFYWVIHSNTDVSETRKIMESKGSKAQNLANAHGLTNAGDTMQHRAETSGYLPAGNTYTNNTALTTAGATYETPTRELSHSPLHHTEQYLFEDNIHKLKITESNESLNVNDPAEKILWGKRETVHPTNSRHDSSKSSLSPNVVSLQNQERAYGPRSIEHPPTEDLPQWAKVQEKLFQWACIWPISQFNAALQSTEPGNQVNGLALTIWATQTYKRYIRECSTATPPTVVDRLFIRPELADALNNAVFVGKHVDAGNMLRDLWTSYGFNESPRIILTLCSSVWDINHWVVHKFYVKDGRLVTYNIHPQRNVPDHDLPLGWWFAIRSVWPDIENQSLKYLDQKKVHLGQQGQPAIDNSVATAAIWRNLLMGSRAERPVDLVRLRDLIQIEVKALMARKESGRLSISQ